MSKHENKYKKGEGPDPNKPPSKKAKLLRMERKQEKLLKRGMSLEKLNTEPQTKTLGQFLNDIPKEVKHKLTVSDFITFLLYANKIVILLSRRDWCLQADQDTNGKKLKKSNLNCTANIK